MTLDAGRRRWGAGAIDRTPAARVVLAVLLALVLGGVGCERKRTYRQETPDDVIQSALEMVKAGDTERLSDLVYADSPEMRALLNRLGVLFGHMQELARAAEARFPEEMAALKAKAAQAAAEGRPDPLLGALASSARRPRGAPRNDRQMEDLFNRLFADPYGWLERNEHRLTALRTSDDTAAVMLDNKPLIPGMGLPMRMNDGKWYIVLPTHFPGIADVMPRSRHEWSILGSLVTVLDRAVVEMARDVKEGRVPSLEFLGDTARKKAMMPAVLTVLAYQKELEVRRRLERRMRQFQARARDWAEAREASPKLMAALSRLAPSRLEPLIRKNKAPSFERISNADFEGIIGPWLKEAGLEIRPNREVSGEAVESELARWEQAAEAGKR